MTDSGTVIGAHCSAAGGLWKAVGRATAIEAEALQIFGSSPRAWRPTKHTAEAYARFRDEFAASGMREAWLHGTYLVNLAAPSDEQYAKSIDSVAHALDVARQAGARGVVLHTGSHGGRGLDTVLPRIVEAIERIFDQTPGDSILALENAAGHGAVIGGSFAELGAILRAVGSARLQVCLDTCHAFAAGYDIASPEGMREAVAEFDAEVGLDHLVVMHANDSKQGLGSQRDRHENIGDGAIGLDGFRTILGESALAGRALLLEVPGIEDDGPDLENVRRLKRIRDDLDP